MPSKKAPLPDAPYTSRIIKGGALVADTTALLASWDLAEPAAANLARLQRSNALAKSSRVRLADVLTVLRRRYVEYEDIFPGLASLVQGGLPIRELIPILYFQTAWSDRLLFDFVVDFVRPRAIRPGREVSAPEARAWLLELSATRKTAAPWSVPTANRVVQGLLSALRDVGVLQGQRIKRIAMPPLAPVPFAFIAFVLKERAGASSRVVNHPAWRLFFLERGGLERMFGDAHQEGLLQYQAAGSVVRLEFPASTVEEYGVVLAEGGHHYIGGRPSRISAPGGGLPDAALRHPALRSG